MKFSVFAIAALAAATSSSCIVSATATRKRKIMKKGGSLSGSYGATGPTDVIPIGSDCGKTSANHNPICAIPPELDHGVCRSGPYDFPLCQSGQPGSYCGQTSDCVVQNDLDPPHAVCCGPNETVFYYNAKCQR